MNKTLRVVAWLVLSLAATAVVIEAALWAGVRFGFFHWLGEQGNPTLLFIGWLVFLVTLIGFGAVWLAWRMKVFVPKNR